MAQTEGAWLYGYSIAHVQQYLLAGIALRDIQGGSQLLEELCIDRFSEMLRAAGLPADSVLSQAAAGARVLSPRGELLQALYATWPAVVDALAPGAQVEQALVPVEAGGLGAAQDRLGRLLKASRIAPLRELPQAGPLAVRCRRTALPAQQWVTVGKEQPEPLDRGAAARLTAWRALNNGTRPGRLDQRFLGGAASGVRFATGREADEELTGDDAYVAVVHADGNGVGQIVTALSAQPDGPRCFRAFSSGLAAATSRAAGQAVVRVLLPHARDGILPARPVVLGGDDLTLIVRAPLAVAFAEAFLEAFETETASVHPGGLTACAGVAIVKARFPFDRAHDLAEGLCGRAKRHVRGQDASALSFFRVTTGLPGGVEDIFERELRARGGKHKLSFEAYGVGARANRAPASLAALRGLAAALPEDQKGALRTLLSTLSAHPAQAQTDFQRIVEVLNHRRKAKEKPGGVQLRQHPEVSKLLNCLGDLTGNNEGGIWDETDRSPLYDAFTLRGLEGWKVPR